MPMTYGKDKNAPGTFCYEIYGGFDLVEVGRGYPTRKECEVAAQNAFRAFHMSNFDIPATPIQNDYMELDGILSEIDI